MSSHLRYLSIIVISILGLTVSSSSFGAESAATKNKINKLTKDLKKLPNQAAPTPRVGSLVKKLVKLRPGKTTEYYLIGLRKAGQSGPAGDVFAKKLGNDIKKLVKNSDLSAMEINKIIRRVEKADRTYVPPAPTPAPYSAEVRPAPFKTFA